MAKQTWTGRAVDVLQKVSDDLGAAAESHGDQAAHRIDLATGARGRATVHWFLGQFGLAEHASKAVEAGEAADAHVAAALEHAATQLALGLVRGGLRRVAEQLQSSQLVDASSAPDALTDDTSSEE